MTLDNKNLLSERALLIKPSWSIWRGEITDRTASFETAARYKARDKAIRTTKFLIPKEAIDPISAVSTAMRAFVRAESLPWLWDGVSLLPTDNYFPFMEGWREHSSNMNRELRGLQASWPRWIATGQRDLGDLAREYDYPTINDLPRLFRCSLDVFPVPSTSDFRAEVTDAEAEAIREQLQSRLDQQLLDAQSFLWQQMSDCVGHIVERLGAYGRNADGKITGRFHDTLIGNLRDLTERLARLNVTRDPAIEAMRLRLAATLCPYEPEELRKNDQLRASVHDEAKRIAVEMAGFWSNGTDGNDNDSMKDAAE